MKRFVSIGSIALLIALISCSKGKKEIVVGVAAPLTGEVASYGDWCRKASMIAQEEVNSEGGIQGKPLRLIFEDSKCEPKEGVTVAKKLIDVDKVSVIIGEICSSVTLAMAPVAEQNKVILFTPISSNYKITYAGDYIFRLAPSDALQGTIIAKWAEKLGFNTAGILYNNNDYGKGLEDAFKKDFESLGGKVLASESYEENSKDFRTQLTKIKNVKPDFIFAPAYPAEAGPILRQRKELGIRIPLIGTDPYHDPTVFQTGGDATEGILFTDVASGSGPVWETFSIKYKGKYGEEPNIVAAEAYDAVKVVAYVMGKEGIKADDVKRGLYNLKGYVGATGKIEFDKNGDCITKTFQKFKIENGKYVQLSD